MSDTKFDEALKVVKEAMKRLDEAVAGDLEKEKLAFGYKVLLFRKERRLSQTELADRLFVTKMAVIKWEKGTVLPLKSTYERLIEIGVVKRGDE